MSSPPKPPYGELIEEARAAARLSKREAARRAGISDAWWRYVTEGRQGETPIRGTAETVAAMALAVHLSPERLETEGERPDAAEILRAGLSRPAAVALSGSGTLGVSSDLETLAEEAEILFPGDLPRQAIWMFSGDRTKQVIWQTLEPRKTKLAIIDVIDRKRGTEPPPAQGEAAAG